MDFIIKYFKYLSICLKIDLAFFVVALEHNYITGVAIAESAELAEITNTMRDSNITFIDTSVNYKLSNWDCFRTDHPLRIHPLSLNLILQQTRCRLHLHQLPISKRSFPLVELQ
ncbi:hypothetical protein T01_10368 [Trichinella spiralis]|uniref:Uncharacterized protein n=1 Tax=Trichinella spiralis TaxID=6334 RepID=A0A0V1AQH5_TRISP|nr:hypothetical protein T01_10368 [Trichinella spiralis]